MEPNVDNEDNSGTIVEFVNTTEKRDRNNKSSRNPDPKHSSVSTVVESGTALIKDRLRDMNMLVQGTKLPPLFFDEYRRIKRPLLSNAFGKSSSLVERGNLILVTSSLPGEGKTHTAINLALSFASERDHTVLLIDCDVARHGTSRALGIADRPGLIDVIEEDDFTIGDAMMRTDIPQLSLVSAGKQHEFVTELLSSRRMADLVTEIGERYDDRIIVFDGPPLIPTPQTQVLTGLVGQVVFVVEAGKTPQSVVEEALELIPEGQAVGLLMNKSEGLSERGSYYSSYYGPED